MNGRIVASLNIIINVIFNQIIKLIKKQATPSIIFSLDYLGSWRGCFQGLREGVILGLRNLESRIRFLSIGRGIINSAKYKNSTLS